MIVERVLVRSSLGTMAQLFAACVVLGLGVGLVLTADLGSEGYSSLINGLPLSAGVPYAEANWLVGLTAVLLAWSRGVQPGLGTLTHPVIVGPR